MANSSRETDLVHLFKFSVGVAFARRNFIWKFHATEYDPLGIPDIIGVIEGRFVGIEAKVEGNYFSDAQKAKIRLIDQAGGVAAGLYQLKSGATFLIPADVVQSFSLKDRSLWQPLLPKQWTDDQGRAHSVLNLTPLKALIMEAKNG